MKPTILLVDDDPAVRGSIAQVLEDEGYAIVPAADGLQAVAAAQVHHVDLALLDINMPRMNGWEAFEEMVRNDPLLPFIVITARPDQLYPALSHKVSALMEKPLDFPHLLQTIRHFIEESMDKRRARIEGKPAEFYYVPGADPSGTAPRTKS